MDLSPAAVRLYLALLLEQPPVSVDRCAGWGLTELSELLKLLSQAAEHGWLSEADGKSGSMSWSDPEAAELLFERAEAADWQAVTACIDFASWGPRAAREAAQRGDVTRAKLLYRALVIGLHASSEQHDEARWLAVVMEALRLFRREVQWLSASLQQQAHELAVSLGDHHAEAVLLAIRAYEQLRAGQAGEAEAWCDRALELSAQLGDADDRQPILLYAANNWILLGRLSDALSLLESFLGNIPPDLLPPQSPSQPRDTLTEASLATLANVYAWTGSDDRALALLHRMVDVGSQSDLPLLAKMAKVYLGWFHADRNNLQEAERWSDATMAALEPDDAYLWFASQPRAWVRMQQGDAAGVRAQLEAGQRSRVAIGHLHFQNSYLLDVLAWLEEQDLEPIEGLTLEAELERLVGCPDLRMRGAAHRFEALRRARTTTSDEAAAEIEAHFAQSAKLLRASGAVVELRRTLRGAAGWAQQRGRDDDGERWLAQLRIVERLGSADDGVSDSDDVRASHVARAIVDLGRLTLLAHRREGFFGEISARICRELRVERCALFDTTDEVTLLAARGGDRDWLAALEAVVTKQQPDGVRFSAPPGSDGSDDSDDSDGGGGSDDSDAAAGQLVLIPYRIDELHRRGWVCLENRRREALVGPADHALLESLGVQMSVLIGNVQLWEELSTVRQRLERENRYYREEIPTPVAAGRMVGESPAFRQLFDLIAKVAPTGSAALILGETGVGKELVAREIHGLSAHRSGPFIAAHVASMPAGLVAGALFGHERGAFTGATEQVRGRFELANGGTIFLDEIGELGLDDQVRLLRVLQEGTFERVGGTTTVRSDFRLVAATNRSLEAMVADGRFREDLFYRLNVFPIPVPPLRDRRDDIPRLALHFLDRFSRQAGRAFEGIGEADVDRLVAYDWPGNVRELEHVIERAVVLSQPPMLKIPALDAKSTDAPSPARRAERWLTLADNERDYVREVLVHCGGRITGAGGAAELLGLKPTTLQSRIDKLELRDALRQARANANGRK